MIMQTRKNDNAFPLYVETDDDDILENGLTKREYFTVMILQGILADAALGFKESHDTETVNHVVSLSVEIADLLVKKLNEN